MDTSLFALRRLRYRPLCHLLNTRLIISSFDQIERDILAALISDVSEEFRLASTLSNLEIMFAKYGFLDLDFVTPRNMLTVADKIDRRAMLELGYSPRPTKQGKTDRACMEALMSSVKQETYLRMFLSSDLSRDAMARILDETKQHHSTGTQAITAAVFAIAEKLKKRFPIVFTIEDACMTNCDGIWLSKHVYL
jgi:hypothetical protein